jgi:hypothetical protein
MLPAVIQFEILDLSSGYKNLQLPSSPLERDPSSRLLDGNGRDGHFFFGFLSGSGAASGSVFANIFRLKSSVSFAIRLVRAISVTSAPRFVAFVPNVFAA